MRMKGPTCALAGPRAHWWDPNGAESRREGWIRRRGSDHEGRWWQLGPTTGSLNPLMRSKTLLVAWWAARLGHRLSG